MRGAAAAARRAAKSTPTVSVRNLLLLGALTLAVMVLVAERSTVDTTRGAAILEERLLVAADVDGGGGGGACVHVPKDIYMLWDKGFEHAPDWERTCLWTWQHHNPDWTVHAMNMSVAMERADVFRWISEEKWNNIKHKHVWADIIRVLILARYGGVWADASVACNAPLTGGVIMERLAARGGDVLQFRRDDPQARRSPLSYWIASWFIAAPGPGLAAGAVAADSDLRCSYAMWRWREEVKVFSAEQDPKTYPWYVRQQPRARGGPVDRGPAGGVRWRRSRTAPSSVRHESPPMRRAGVRSADAALPLPTGVPPRAGIG